MKKYKFLTALFLASFPIFGVNGRITCLPKTHGSACFRDAVELMYLNDHEREAAIIAEKLKKIGLEENIASACASAEIRARDEAILSQFKIFHRLKILAGANPEIMAGEEGNFFNEQSHRRGFLILGHNMFNMPRTYADYLLLREKNLGEEPRFFDENEYPLENPSPFGIMGMRYSFGNLDFLRSQNIEIPENYENLSRKAKFYLACAGGLSIAVSQGIIRNVIAIDDARQEIYRYHQRVPLAQIEKDVKNLDKLRVYAHYLDELSKSRSVFTQLVANMDQLKEQYIQHPWRVRLMTGWFGAHVSVRMAGLKLLEVLSIFKPKLGSDWTTIENAFTALCMGRLEDEDENIDLLILQIDDALFQLQANFTKQLAYELLDGREQEVLFRIKEALHKAGASKDFVLIYNSGNDFLRYSSHELPVVVPQEFWQNNRRAVIRSVTSLPDNISENIRLYAADD